MSIQNRTVEQEVARLAGRAGVVGRAELLGYRYHRSRHAWEQDRRREREAYARGDQHRRYTYHNVMHHPAPMLEELRGLLYGSTRPRRIA